MTLPAAFTIQPTLEQSISQSFGSEDGAVRGARRRGRPDGRWVVGARQGRVQQRQEVLGERRRAHHARLHQSADELQRAVPNLGLQACALGHATTESDGEVGELGGDNNQGVGVRRH